MLIKGNKLTDQQRRQVLAAYIYRHLDTTSKTDQKWLDKHAFYFLKDGSRRSAKHKHCVPEYLAD